MKTFSFIIIFNFNISKIKSCKFYYIFIIVNIVDFISKRKNYWETGSIPNIKLIFYFKVDTLYEAWYLATNLLLKQLYGENLYIISDPRLLLNQLMIFYPWKDTQAPSNKLNNHTFFKLLRNLFLFYYPLTKIIFTINIFYNLSCITKTM